MKKILFASTALIASAGIAAADVSVGGDGRMGVTYNSAPTTGDKFAFTSRIRISFRASGTTDSGMTFGGSIRADNAGNSGNVSMGGSSGTAGNVFISGEFGRIMMGDVSGAPEFVVGDLDFTSLTGIGDFNENAYLSNTNRPAMRYDYSMGDFTFAVSADNPGVSNQEAYGIGVAYDAGMFGVALGHERQKVGATTMNHTIGAVTASVDGVADFKVTYGRASGGLKQYGLSATGTFDATTVSAFARRDEGIGTSVRTDYVGIGASYNLGGGASLRGGVVNIKPQGGSSSNRADFGVSMSF